MEEHLEKQMQMKQTVYDKEIRRIRMEKDAEVEVAPIV